MKDQLAIQKVYKVEGIEFDTYDAAAKHIRSIKLFNLLKDKNLVDQADIMLMCIVDALIENQLEVIKILRD